MARNPNLLASVSFPSKAAQEVASRDALQSLFHTTVAGDSFHLREKDQRHEANTENIGPIFNMGKARSKHMGYQLKQAPIWSRGSQKYFSDFEGSAPVDQLLNQSIARTRRFEEATGSLKNSAPMDFRTQYREFFPKHTVEDGLYAKQSSKPPEPDTHSSRILGGPGKLQTTKSKSQEFHMAPFEGVTYKSEQWRPPTQSQRRSKHCDDALNTTYRSHFPHHRHQAPASEEQRLKARTRQRSAPSLGSR